MTFLDIAKEVLNSSDKPMHYKEIWDKAVELGLDKKLPKSSEGKRLTPWNTIIARLSTDIKYNPENTVFIRTERGRFFLKNKIKNEKEIEIIDEKLAKEEEKANIKKIKEEDLHKPLTKYLYDMKIYSKTINANSTSEHKKGKMKWGTPDIVAVTFKEYINKSVLRLCEKINVPTTELCAYELKLELKMHNLTEYFFQALSNSGWANEAWLVAEDIDEDNIELMDEIKRLNQAFGVGIIHLDYENPEESSVLYAAKKNINLDLDTMDKLCNNREFKDFIEDVDDILSSSSIDRRIREKVAAGKLNNPE